MYKLIGFFIGLLCAFLLSLLDTQCFATIKPLSVNQLNTNSVPITRVTSDVCDTSGFSGDYNPGDTISTTISFVTCDTIKIPRYTCDYCDKDNNQDHILHMEDYNHHEILFSIHGECIKKCIMKAKATKGSP